MNDLLETDYIVLKKVPYSDHAVIIGGLSPENGWLSFIVRGGLGGVKRSFPELELFRLVHVSYKLAKGDLHKPVAVDILDGFNLLPNNYERYCAACWIATFASLNVMPMLPHPHFFNAVEVAIRRLANDKITPEAILTGVALAFIFEEGWLAHAIQSEQASSQCRQILEMAAGAMPPEISDDCWKLQFDWTKNILLINDCRLPY